MAISAQRRAEDQARMHHTHKKIDQPPLLSVVEEKLKLRWSSGQVSRHLTATYPEDESMEVSRESIYTYLYEQGKVTLK